MIYILIPIYIILFMATYSASFAYWMGRFPDQKEAIDIRENLAFSVAWALFCPATFWVTIFTTGFFYYGFLFKPKPIPTNPSEE